tara:strand:- start:2537 stop:2941 length:405 start_codon:yes stop_codon:yes gene_type:complete
MKFEDKIYFLSDILDEYEKRGGDRDAAEAMYWTLVDELIDDISNTDSVVYKISNFGTLYYTVDSLHNTINGLERILNNNRYKNENDKKNIEKNLSVFRKKLEKMSILIDRAKEQKLKNIWFFRKRFNPKLIKNG